VKLTVDGSFHERDQMVGVAIVLRNEEGWPIVSAFRYIPDCDSPYEAELCACLEGLELSMQLSQLPVIIESDYIQLN
jgi:ribonuclease HI